MSNESNERYVPSKESYERNFANFLDSQINPEIQVAKKMGYTKDQAIELVKVWELLKVFDGIEAEISMLQFDSSNGGDWP